MKLSRQQIIFSALVLALAVAVAFAIVLWGRAETPKYVALRLVTGELYFGKMSWFPSPKLTGAWLIQGTQNGGFTLDKFQNLAWRPTDTLRLNREQIVFWTYLDPQSPVAQAMEGKVQVLPTPVPSPTK